MTHCQFLLDPLINITLIQGFIESRQVFKLQEFLVMVVIGFSKEFFSKALEKHENSDSNHQCKDCQKGQCMIEFIWIYIIEVVACFDRIIFKFNWIHPVPKNLLIGKHPIGSSKVNGSCYLQSFQG
jgi:hypothetical protein